MSHFAVLVAGSPIEPLLQPFHEFECTGWSDQYVQDTDVTDEKRAEYNEGSCSFVRNADGEQVERYDDRFYRDPTPEELKEMGPIPGSYGSVNGASYMSKDWGDGRGHRPKVHHVPEGWTSVSVPKTEAMTFREYVEEDGVKVVPFGEEPKIGPVNTDKYEQADAPHRYGYALVDASGEIVKVVRRTNPNRQWDWWQIGGRFSNRLRLKDGRYVDSAAAGQVDWDGLRADGERTSGERWDRFHALVGDLTLTPWEEVLAAHNNDDKAARTVFFAQPFMQALRADHDFSYMRNDEMKLISGDRAAYTEHHGINRGVLFAVVKDGEWHERGNMGWWGCVMDEKDRDAWAKEFHTLVSALPPETTITVVDCHI